MQVSAEAEDHLVVEGLLEVRGSGRVGRWEQYNFRLEDGILSSTPQPGARSILPFTDLDIGEMELGGISKCEFSFTVLRGRSTVRLRAANEGDALEWYEALEVSLREVEASKEIVQVTVVRASGLRNADIFDKSDPFVVCTVGGIEQFRTFTVTDCLDPVWEHGPFDVKLAGLGGPVERLPVLSFEVYDLDHFSKPDFLGVAAIPAERFASSGFTGELKIEKGQDKLYVKISRTLDMPRERRASAVAKLTTARVAIVEAKSLRGADISTKSDPYVICKFGDDEQCRTHTISNNHNPVWKFGPAEIRFGSLGNPGDRPLLSFEVFDKDRTTKDDSLGVAMISCDRFAMTGFDGWLPLVHGRGASLRVQITLPPAATRSTDARTSGRSSGKARDSDAGGPPDRVTVQIQGTRGLRNSEVSAGASDPYVVCKFVGDDRVLFRTGVGNDDANPARQHDPMEFDLLASADGDPPDLSFEIYDEDLLNDDDFLGKCTVPWETARAGFNGPVELEGGKGSLQIAIGPVSSKQQDGLTPTPRTMVPEDASDLTSMQLETPRDAKDKHQPSIWDNYRPGWRGGGRAPPAALQRRISNRILRSASAAAVGSSRRSPQDGREQSPARLSKGGVAALESSGQLSPRRRSTLTPPQTPRARIQELHDDHKKRQARQSEKLQRAQQEETKIQAEMRRKEDERRKRFAGAAEKAPAEIDRQQAEAASQRLYHCWQEKEERMQDLCRKVELEKQQALAKARCARPAIPEPPVSPRVREDIEKRVEAWKKREEQRKKDEENEDAWLKQRNEEKKSSGRKSSEGPGKRMYSDAVKQQQKAERRKQEHKEEEEKRIVEGLTQWRKEVEQHRLRDAPVHVSSKLHHVRRDPKPHPTHAQETPPLQSPRTVSPRRAAPVQATAVEVSVLAEGLDCALLTSDSLEPALQSRLREAIKGVLVSEASVQPSQYHVQVTYSAPSQRSRGNCVVQASLYPVPGAAASATKVSSILRKRCSSLLCDSLAAALRSVPGVGAICIENPWAISVQMLQVTTSLHGGGPQERPPAAAELEEKLSQAALGGPSPSTPRQQEGGGRSVSPCGQVQLRAEQLLGTVLRAVDLRCGLQPDVDARSLQASLARAMAAYRQAVSECQQGEGFASLCKRPSQRLLVAADGKRRLVQHDAWPASCEPNPIRQTQEDLELLMRTASKAQNLLQARILQVTDGGDANAWPAGEVRERPAGVPTALFAYNPGPKSRGAAETKALVRFAPAEGLRRHRHLLDLARLALVFSSCDLLTAGLDSILQRFEVVSIQNSFQAPNRLGSRVVEVMVTMRVPMGEDTISHVCELRLEEISFFEARQAAAAHLSDFDGQLRAAFAACCRSRLDTSAFLASVSYLARTVLTQPSESHSLRLLRQRLCSNFGSVVAAWRCALSTGPRLLAFKRFRELCGLLRCQQEVMQYWAALDAGLGSSISFFELDSEAVLILLRFRSCLLELVELSGASGALGGDGTAIAFTVLARLAQTELADRIECSRFCSVCAGSMGIPKDEGERICRYLDSSGCISSGLLTGRVLAGQTGSAPAPTVTRGDIEWLMRLPTFVDADALSFSMELEDPAAEADARSELIAALFQLLSPLRGLLGPTQLRRFAGLCGFHGGRAEWAEEFAAMGKWHGWNVNGPDIQQFKQMLNESGAGAYCTNAQLHQLLADLALHGDSNAHDGHVARQWVAYRDSKRARHRVDFRDAGSESF